MTGKRWKLLTVALAAGLAITAAYARGVVASTDADPPFEDPCIAVMSARSNAADPLASAGLRGLGASTRLLRNLSPRNLTCSSTMTPSESRVRGVFAELTDASGTTTAVYVALHPKESSAVWQQYLRETFFSSQLDFDERGDGSMLALMRGHPQAPAALAAYRDAGQVTPLWQAVVPLFTE